ncbi:MAG: nucleotide exchange factor GrpE, partial [Planctomycetota bacterium]|nr:nucleotide exchange factor GrpE [Planctomycetota bacterium]
MTAETGPEQEAAPDRTDESVDQDSPETESLESLRAERDEALAARQRAMADFSNFQRRSAENEARARVQGMAEVVRNLVPALDQFEMALGQSTAGGDADGLVEGLRLVKDGFLQALER